MGTDDKSDKGVRVRREGTYQAIVRGLAARQSYLLFFGVVLVLLGGSAAASLIQVVGGGETRALPYVLLALCAVVLVALVTVVYLEGRQAPSLLRLGNQDFEPVIEAVQTNLRAALERVHPVFHDWMLADCERFRANTDHWANGQLHTEYADYKQLLVDAYERAQASVFATSGIDYLAAWTDVLGLAILDAHRRNQAKVTRVFLFESANEVPAEALEEMRKQHESGVDVRVFLAAQCVGGWDVFPRGINRNFVFIDDGEIIGSTDPPVGQKFTGTWHFKEPNQKATYRRVVEALVRHSRPYAEWTGSPTLSGNDERSGTMGVTSVGSGQGTG